MKREGDGKIIWHETGIVVDLVGAAATNMVVVDKSLAYVSLHIMNTA